jgi:hypothetical protein
MHDLLHHHARFHIRTIRNYVWQIRSGKSYCTLSITGSKGIRHPSSTYVRMLSPDDTAEQRQITTCHGSIPTYTVHPSYPLPPAGGHVNGFLHACTAGRIYVQLVVYTTNDGTCVQYTGSELEGSTTHEGLSLCCT